MILLDTHVLIWLTMTPRRVGETAATRIRSETVAEAVLFSPISIWETAMLVDKNKLNLGQTVQRWAQALIAQRAIIVAQFTPDMAAEAGTLPPKIHGDPADRIIVATARAYECPVITADRKILDYAKAGHVQAIDGRR